MYAEARTPIAASLMPLRVGLLFAGVALVEVSLLAGAVLWTVAAATVAVSILIARSIDRRPPLIPAVATVVPEERGAAAGELPAAADASHVPAPQSVDEAAAPAASDGSTNGALRPSVVCGVDGSAESKAAVALATRLAERLGSRLVLAHVIDARHRNHIPVGIAAGAVGARRISVPTDEHVRAAVAVGFAADRLADLAEEERAELLVVGSRGRGGLKAAFLGSVSSSLIGVARCPVQVVRPGIPGS